MEVRVDWSMLTLRLILRGEVEWAVIRIGPGNGGLGDLFMDQALVGLGL